MIHLNHLSFHYRKRSPLFEDLSLSLANGGAYGLLGKNGAGKTTLLKLMCGLLFPRSGTCSIHGLNPPKRHPEMLSNMYMIFEEFDLPDITTTAYQRLYSPFYPDFDQVWFQQLLVEFGLESLSKIQSLSFGQRKKFLLSFGMATRSKILLIDEPTNGLDIPSKTQFRKVLTSAISKERIVLISTHQVKDIEHLIDTVLVLDDGQVIFNQPVDRIARHLSFSVQSEIPKNAIHYENFVGGYSVLRENNSQEKSPINLELLFNSLMSNPIGFKGIFSGDSSC